MQDIGFNHIAKNVFFSTKPEMDSIGAIAASKQLTVGAGSYTLVAVAIRGGGYEKEWASNFTLGTQGLHAGFETAKMNVLAFLADYVVEQGISGNIKIWVTGYSRAAATANLVAGALSDGVALLNCQYTLQDLYAYTFETPRGLVNEIPQNNNYNSIFNIVNNNDLVPKVAPEIWNFAWYGSEKNIPTKTSSGAQYLSYVNKMLERFKALGGAQDVASQYVVDNFVAYSLSVETVDINTYQLVIMPVLDLSLEIFLSTFITDFVTTGFLSRENYVDTYQNGIRALCSIFCDKDNNTLFDVFFNLLKMSLVELIIQILTGQLEAAFNKVSNVITQAFEECGISTEGIDDFIQQLWELIWILLSKFTSEGYTILMNSESIIQAHFPELCLAWLQSMDSYFTKEELVPMI